MLTFKSEPQAPKSSPRPRRPAPWRLYLLLLVLAPVMILTVERWRGQIALRKWKRDAIDRGEILDAKSLWPVPTSRAREFSGELALANAELAPGFSAFCGQLVTLYGDGSGKFRRGSQEPRPPFYDHGTHTNTWQQLEDMVEQSQAGLGYLRELMKNPPSDHGYDIVQILETNDTRSFVQVRIASQALQTAAMFELHRNHLPEALADLRALMAFGRLYDQDPSLLDWMIRTAVLGMTVDMCCDALQSDGWTEPELAELQHASVESSALLAQLPRVMEAWRIVRLKQMESFRSQSFQSWHDSQQQYYKMFGMTQTPDAFQKWVRVNSKQPVVAYLDNLSRQWSWKSPADVVAPWQQWLIHPVWSMAWADQEELDFLRSQELDVQAFRDATRQHSWLQLTRQLDANHEAYHPPPVSARFYGELPWLDERSSGIIGVKTTCSNYPYPVLNSAAACALKTLTLDEMMITAIALKRFELRHGQPPLNLAMLVPEYLARQPIDFMNGQCLGYCRKPNGTYSLSSVGNKPREPAGAMPVSAPASQANADSPWESGSWVWPQMPSPPKRPPVVQQSRGG